MRHSFIDLYSDLGSPLHRLDPRAKIIAIFAAVLLVASTPRDHLGAFVYYYILIALLALMSRVPFRHIALRCLIASPFIVMAAVLPYFSLWIDSLEWWQAAGVDPVSENVVDDPGHVAASVILKAYAAIILLTLLTASSRFYHLLWGMRRLRVPEVLHVIATLMYRYIFILLEEWQRTSHARQLRSPHGLRVSRLSVYGKQIAQVFVRGWERAERVQAAMVLRGFRGGLPAASLSSFGAWDALFAATALGLFLLVRLAPL